MEARRHIIVLLTVVAVVGIGVGHAAKEGGASKKVSGTRDASCLLKITCDPAVFPLSVGTLDYLMRTDGIAGRAGKDVLGLSASDAAECFLLEEVPLRGRPGGYGMGAEDQMQRMEMGRMMGLPPGDAMMMDTEEYTSMMEGMGMDEMGMDEMMMAGDEEPGMGGV